MQTGEDILFTAPGPDPIPTATTEIVGTPGNALNVYWIVSHFPIGSVVSGPFPQKSSPNLLDFQNYVHISWLPTPGASSYDLLFTKELRLPRQPGQFLLAAGLTDTEFRDTGQSLSCYDLAGIPLGAPQEEHIYFDNRDFKQPTLRFIPWPIQVSSIIFEDGSSQNTAGGGGTPAPPDRSVQFNNDGVFGGSPGLTFFSESNELDIGTGSSPLMVINPGSISFKPFPFLPDFVAFSISNSASTATITGAGTLSIDCSSRMALTTENGNLVLFAGLDFFLQNNFASISSNALINGIDISSFPGPITLQATAGSGNVGIGKENPQFALDVNGVISSTYGLFGANGLTINAGGNVLQLLFGVSDKAIFSDGLIDVISALVRLSGNFAVGGTEITLSNLPNVPQGPGTKRLWYDPADGNTVKFAP